MTVAIDNLSPRARRGVLWGKRIAKGLNKQSGNPRGFFDKLRMTINSEYK